MHFQLLGCLDGIMREKIQSIGGPEEESFGEMFIFYEKKKIHKFLTILQFLYHKGLQLFHILPM